VAELLIGRQVAADDGVEHLRPVGPGGQGRWGGSGGGGAPGAAGSSRRARAWALPAWAAASVSVGAALGAAPAARGRGGRAWGPGCWAPCSSIGPARPSRRTFWVSPSSCCSSLLIVAAAAMVERRGAGVRRGGWSAMARRQVGCRCKRWGAVLSMNGVACKRAGQAVAGAKFPAPRWAGRL
jgi:hypothetical protein